MELCKNRGDTANQMSSHDTNTWGAPLRGKIRSWRRV